MLAWGPKTSLPPIQNSTDPAETQASFNYLELKSRQDEQAK